MTQVFCKAGLVALLLGFSRLVAATASVDAALTGTGPSLAPVRQVCADEIRASRALGNKGDNDFDDDLIALYDNLRRPPAAGSNGSGPRADPAAFSKDADGRASYLLVSCLIYLVDGQRVDMDVVRIADTWPGIKAELIENFGAVAAAPSVEPGAAQCEQAYAAQEAEFAQIDGRSPARQPGVSADAVPVLPGLQVALYMTSQRLLLLDTQCKGQARYAEYPLIRRQYDDAERACRAYTRNAGDCQAKVAW